MARSTGKEAIRLWFEFLKRAYLAGDVKVNANYYKAWGDVATTKFDTWWRAHAEQLFPNRQVEVTQRYLSDAGVVNVCIPMALTPSEAGNQIRQVLIEHYKEIDHHPKPAQGRRAAHGVGW